MLKYDYQSIEIMTLLLFKRFVMKTMYRKLELVVFRVYSSGHACQCKPLPSLSPIMDKFQSLYNISPRRIGEILRHYLIRFYPDIIIVEGKVTFI